MKNLVLFLILMMSACYSSSSIDLKSEAVKLSLFQIAINNNTQNTYYGAGNGTPASGGTSFFCGTNCFKIGTEYSWNDRPGWGVMCNDNFQQGNSDFLPQPGERALVKIPLIYTAKQIITDISITLIPDNNAIQIANPTLRYANNPGTEANALNCGNDGGYGSWSQNHTQCNRNSCSGYKITIPGNFSGSLSFKALIYSSLGNTVLDFSL